MKIYLEQIQLHNFKSFSGVYRSGILNSFSSIIGPNGSGKSNLMDGLLFSLGEQNLDNLRVNELAGLACRTVSNANKDVYAKSVFRIENDDEIIKKSFKRSIIDNDCLYEINEIVVTKEFYIDELKQMKINTAEQNFFVLQSDLKSFINKTPHERSKFFEKICGSDQYKKDYDNLKENVDEINLKIKRLFDEEKEFKSKLKVLLKFENNKLEFQKLCEKKEIYHRDIILMKLKLIDDSTAKIEAENKELSQRRENLMDEMNQIEGKIAELNENHRQYQDTDEFLRKKKLKVVEVYENNVKELDALERKHTVLERRLILMTQSLDSLKQTQEESFQTINELTSELNKVTEELIDYQDDYSQKFDTTLEQMETYKEEYRQLKVEVYNRAISFYEEYDLLSKNKDKLMDKLENIKRQEKENMNEIIFQENHQKHLEEKNKWLLEEIKKINEQMAECKEKQESLRKLRDENQEINREINKIKKELDSIAFNNGFMRKENEKGFIDDLIKTYSGVYGFVSMFCQPIHQRFNLAMIKVFGKNLDAIIVDTYETAVKCIQYLDTNHINNFTFLPLDCLKFQPIKQHYRLLEKTENISNVRLLYDVLKFPKEIDNAILFITRNTLVCETAENAHNVAYNNPTGKGRNCVALDGTLFKKDGTFSGGQSLLQYRADEINSQRKKALTKNLDELIQKQLLNDKLINQYSLEVSKLTGSKKLKYLQSCQVEMLKQISENEKKLQDSNTSREAIINERQEIENAIKELNNKMIEYKEKIYPIEDEVFAQFCKKLNINNIREFSQCSKLYDEALEKKQRLKNHKSKIESILSFEYNRNIDESISKMDSKILQVKDLLKANENDLINGRNKVEHWLKNMNDIKESMRVSSDVQNEITNELNKLKKSLAPLKTDLKNIEKKSKEIEIKTYGLFCNRHKLFLEAKMNSIELPLIEGDFGDIEIPTLSGLSDFEMMTIFQQEHELNINYSVLDDIEDFNLSEIDKILQKYTNELTEMDNTIKNLNIATAKPNALINVKKKLKEIKKKLEEHFEMRRDVNQQFVEIQKKRCEKFMKAFEKLSENINATYKDLTGDAAAQAILYCDDNLEPYLGKIVYECMPHSKAYTEISNLSGGEQAMAALAFLIAIQKYYEVPFLILDEIDAALDPINIKSFIKYLQKTTTDYQIVLISLNPSVFVKADLVVGIYSQMGVAGVCSKMLTLDLCHYTK